MNDPTPSGVALDSRVVMQWAIILALILTLLIVGRGFLIPLAIAVLLWNLLNALANRFTLIALGRWHPPRWLATSSALLTIVLVILLINQILTSQSDELLAAAPVYQANFEKLAARMSGLIGIEQMPSTERVIDSLDLGAFLTWLGGSVGALLTDAVLVAIYVAFLLAEQQYFADKLARLKWAQSSGTDLPQLLETISRQVQTYMWMKTVVSVLTGLVSYAVLKLVGIDFAEVWALLIFMLNYIPNIGSVLGVVFPALLALVQFDTATPFFIVVAGLGTAQFMIGNVVEPALMGRTLNLSSLVIILSLTFWGMIWGLAGMFLCVPITVMTAIVCSHFSGLRGIAVLLSRDGRIADSPSTQDPTPSATGQKP